jgi:hypothetical protein
MVHYEGPELKGMEPRLHDREKEIIPLFHNECCFHANDMQHRAWLCEGQQPLRQKSHGRLIHVSEFISPETGYLVVQAQDRTITREACKIIFPGSNGDLWWDNVQFLQQTREAIEVFELQHPGKTALFVFDHSSTHASLPPDALKVFEMNKSNRGAQRKQHDTVIPATNPYPELRSQVQKMTLSDGRAKGLECVLQERGFETRKVC